MSRTLPTFQLIDHPADLGIEAQGESLSEAFEQAAVGLMSVILDLSSVEPLMSKEVTLQGSGLEHLLVKWLSEVLYLYDGEKFVGRDFSICELRDDFLRATVRGEQFVADKHTTRLDVKAVTYHQLLVEQTTGAGRVRVFLDI